MLKIGMQQKNATSKDYFSAAVDLWNSGQQAEACAMMAQGHALYPDDNRFLFRKATFEWQMGRFEEAVQTYDALLSINPNHASSYINKAKTQAYLQRPWQAIDTCKAGLMSDTSKWFMPDDQDIVFIKIAMLNVKAKAEVQAKRPEDAIRTYGAILDLNPAKAGMAAVKAELEVKSGRPADALQTCNAAIEHEPDNQFVLVTKANAELRLHDFKAFSQTVSQLDSVRPQVIYMTAMAYMLQSQRSRCADLLRPLLQKKYRKDVASLYIAATLPNDPLLPLLKHRIGEGHFAELKERADKIQQDSNAIFDDFDTYSIPVSPVLTRPEFVSSGAVNRGTIRAIRPLRGPGS